MLQKSIQNGRTNKKTIAGKSDEYVQRAIYWQTVADLKNKLTIYYKNIYDDYNCYLEAKRMLDYAPTELIQNINEWIDDRIITEIQINGVSIPSIIQSYPPELDVDFVDAVKCISGWQKLNISIIIFAILTFIQDENNINKTCVAENFLGYFLCNPSFFSHSTTLKI